MERYGGDNCIIRVINILVAMSFFAMISCAPAPRLAVSPVDDIRGAAGYFTLIYYVGLKHGDIRNAVILDIEGDDYEFIPTVKDFQYEILQNITVGEALYETKVFFSENEDIIGVVYNEIFAPDGSVIGLELRPLYYPDIRGDEDILDIGFTMSKKKSVKVSIDFK